MKKKLTLRMDERTIQRAKRYAEQRGISVSKLVENFFAALESQDGEPIEMSPLVSELWGTLEDVDVSEDDYRKHLEDKYL